MVRCGVRRGRTCGECGEYLSRWRVIWYANRVVEGDSTDGRENSGWRGAKILYMRHVRRGLQVAIAILDLARGRRRCANGENSAILP